MIFVLFFPPGAACPVDQPYNSVLSACQKSQTSESAVNINLPLSVQQISSVELVLLVADIRKQSQLLTCCESDHNSLLDTEK